MTERWQECWCLLRKPLIGGGRDWGYLFRRRNRMGDWEYRTPTEDEWNEIVSSTAW